MYKIIRNIHIILGLAITPFLLIYAISATFYAHPFLKFSSTETHVEEFKLLSVTKNPIEIADLLSRKHAIRGSLLNSSVDDSGIIKLEISRPGKLYEIILDTHSNNITSVEKTQSTSGFIKALHEAGFRHKDSVESWWSFAVTIVSVLLIIIVVTGILLWLLQKKNRISGGIFLCLNLLFSITVLAVLRFG